MDNMGYESPINVITSGLRLQAEHEMGHAVVKALQNIQVEINEKELMEILQAQNLQAQQHFWMLITHYLLRQVYQPYI